MLLDEYLESISTRRYRERQRGAKRIKSRADEARELEELKEKVRREMPWYIGKTKDGR